MQVIAYAYGGADAALILSRLEGHGIRAFASDFVGTITLSYLAPAIGGIRIEVFDADAPAARALIAEDGPPRWRRPGWAMMLFLVYAALVAGVPHPPLGLTPIGARCEARPRGK